MKDIRLEVCIDSIESAIAAEQGGADRLEVCGSLATGGTTPSHGLVEQCARQTNLPLMVMVRPHDGSFIYTTDDVAVMLSEIEHAKRLQVHGVVFGCLNADGTISGPLTKQLVAAARPLAVTFHRAFDVCTNPLEGFDLLVELGVDRLLTSGCAATAESGSPFIRTLIERAGVQIKIVAGSGIQPSNAKQIVAATGVTELHASASQSVEPNGSNSEEAAAVSFGANRRVTSAERVREIVQRLKADA